MKTHYHRLAVVVSIVGMATVLWPAPTALAGERVFNGTFTSSAGWTYWQERNNATVTYNNTANKPTGTSQCVYLSSGDFNGGIYQPVTLVAGQTYTLSGSSKGGPGSCTWAEVHIVDTQPVNGTDVTAGMLVKFDNCSSSPWDNSFANANNTRITGYTPDGTGTVVKYIVLKCGNSGSSTSTSFADVSLTGPDPACTYAECFHSPYWFSSEYTGSGSAAAWSLVAGGTGLYQRAARTSAGSSARVQQYAITPGRTYQLVMRHQVQSATGAYWMESAYRLGNYNAQDFDQDSGAWTLVRKWESQAQTWTVDTAIFNSGANNTISIGVKLGSSSLPVTADWDYIDLITCDAPTAVCRDISVALSAGPSGAATVQATDVNNGSVSSGTCTITGYQTAKAGGPFGSSVSFRCSELGAKTVTLRVMQSDGQYADCTATVTVTSPDTDSDGTSDCADDCYQDPAKIAPGVCGCGVSDVDNDGDGTADCHDGCPADPAKTIPGVCGCGVADVDSDGDGTLDCQDQCPNDPNKVAPGQCGCGTPDTDTDGDATADCNDQCPNDSAKITPGICGCGTPDVDSDGDGTRDCQDQCPNDPNKVAPGQCDCGNPDTDTDVDGTADCNDGCPNNPVKTTPGVCGCDLPDVDSDGDGTLDCNDGCPNDPAKIAPGVCGCGVADTDTDADGTADCNDGCPADPAKTAPGACGCGVADTDTDADGAADCIDGCPSDSAKTIPGVCGCGVADVDSDGDGVMDCLDQCAGGPDVDTDGDGVLDCQDGCPNDVAKTEPGQCGCGAADTDTDADGAADCIDGCSADPAKTAPGVCGCGMPDTDTDGDGTADCNDGCPTDPAKVSPGQCGCGVADTDGDGDGTADCVDGCPADPAKTAPGVCGCGMPDTDTDGDGTADCIDGCPADPAKIAPGICGCGVSDVDTDGDGAADCNDQCPTDPAKTAPGICGCGMSDTDSDGDGAADCNDACMLDPAKTVPGICGCGVSDVDTDIDGTADCNDGCPADPAKLNPGNCGCGASDVDTDLDGSADCNDSDDDNDGVPDGDDSAPLNRFVCRDNDGDSCDDCSSGTADPANDGVDTDRDGLCDAGDPTLDNGLVLDVEPGSLYVRPGEYVVVDMDVSNLQQKVNGCQALIGYSSTYLNAGAVAPGGGPWTELIYESWAVPGELDTAIGVKLEGGPDGTQANGTVAIITLIAGVTEGTTRLAFRADGEGGYATLLSGLNGQPVWPSKVDSAYVTIDGTAPAVTVLAPSGGEYLRGGHSYEVRWSATDSNINPNSIKIEYFDGSEWVSVASQSPGGVIIANGVANSGSFIWTPVPSLNIGNAKIRVTAFDLAGNSGSDESDNTFIIDTTSPTVTGISARQGGGPDLTPLGTAVQGVVNIAVAASDNLSGVAGAPTVTVAPLGGSAQAALYVNESPAGTFNYTWSVTVATPNGQATIAVSGLTDRSGNPAAGVTDTFNVNKNQVAGTVSFATLSDSSYSFGRDIVCVATGAGGVVLKTWTVAVGFTNDSGARTASGPYVLTGVPSNIAALSVKTAWHMRKKQVVTPDGTGQTVVASFTLLGGDLDGNNYVNILDYSALRSHWNSPDAVADINGDGEVQLLDYSIMRSSWFRRGDAQ